MALPINEDGTLPMWIDPETGHRRPTTAVTDHFDAIATPGGPHTHDIDDTTDLATSLDAKADTGHAHAPHSHDYADPAHVHAAGDHPDLATHTTLGLAAEHAHPYSGNTHNHDAAYSATAHDHAHTHDYSASGHDHDVDYSAAGHSHDTTHSHLDAELPASLARDAEVTSALATHAATPHGVEHPDIASHDALGLATDADLTTHAEAADPHPVYATNADLTTHAATPHGGEGGGVTLAEVIDALYPVGALWISKNAASPALILGRGTWSQVAQGRYIVGQDTGQTGGDHVGSATHAHAFTQPGDHAVLSHSAHANGAVAAHGNHTHTYTQTVNHVHVQTVNSATTGGLSGYTPDTSSNTPAVSGYSTQNPTGGVATGTTANESASLTHSVTQPDAHTNHAAQSHAGGAVADGSTAPLGFVAYIWERTA